MNLNIIIGWSMVALVIVGVIVFIKLRNKNRERKKLEPLLSFAKENNTEISHFDSWDKTLIGVDNKESESIYFIRNIPGNLIREKIILSEVSGCKMLITERKVKYNKEAVKVIDRIDLIFSFCNHRPELKLEFYNTEYDKLTITAELQLAQKWIDILKTKIKVKKEFNVNEMKKDVSKSAIDNPLVNKITFAKR